MANDLIIWSTDEKGTCKTICVIVTKHTEILTYMAGKIISSQILSKKKFLMLIKHISYFDYKPYLQVWKKKKFIFSAIIVDCENRHSLKYIQHLHNNHSKVELFSYNYLLEIKMVDKNYHLNVSTYFIILNWQLNCQ